MISVIIPAHLEDKYLNKTIDNICKTCEDEYEIIVALNGYHQEVDPRAQVVRLEHNMGERVAMNKAAMQAKGDYLFRIDAHCDFSPYGWDKMLAEVTGEKDITVAVLTAIYHDSTADSHLTKEAKAKGLQNWDRLPGHWYGLCRLIRSGSPLGLEAKWQKPNRDKSTYKTVEPNMAITGCGFMIPKDFYWEIGGADEKLPAMGAIGEEFAIKAWLNGGKVQTRTDCFVGHIFGTGGYSTDGTKRAQQMLYELYGDRYDEIAEKFPDWEGVALIKADQPGPDIRTVIVNRTDETTTRDSDGEVLRVSRQEFRYVWLETEHPEEKGWSEQQIQEKYAPLATAVGDPTVMYPEENPEPDKKTS